MSVVPGYRLKIERAERHTREVAEVVQTFLANNPYSIVKEDDPSAGQRVWKLRIHKCVPAELSAIVGDAIHNARSALDLIAVAVVRHCQPDRVSYNHVKFVIRKSREEFEAALLSNIKGASSEARRIFEDLKPYKGGDEAFWRLHQLDILDKHKALIPVGAAYHSFDMSMVPSAKLLAYSGMGSPYLWEKMRATAPRIRFKPADRQFPLKDGAELYRAPLESPFEDEPQFSFEVAFGEGQILDGEPVIPALTQICEFVKVVCTTFETTILKP